MMSRRLLACSVVTALAMAALLVTAEPASAQRLNRGGFGFGYSPGTGLNFGYGSGGYGYGDGWGYGNRFYGDGYYSPWQSSYGRGYYPGYTGYWGNNYWGNNQVYDWSNSNMTPPAYFSGNPSYYSDGMQGSTFGQSSAMGAGYGGDSYGAMTGAGMNNRVLITTNVPPNAEIWFDDQKTSQTGPVRSFISPPLQEDHNFVYHIRARWTENGRQVEKDRKLEVHPGDRLFVTFTMPRSDNMGGRSSGQYGAAGQFGTETENRGTDRQENADRTLDNRSQPGTQNTSNPRTGGSDNRQQTPNTRPQGESSRPQDRQ